LNIKPSLAKSIVHQMKNIISFEINFMDIAGTIIASTDLSRVGNFHQAAFKVIQTKDVVIVKNNTEYIGAKKGINVPLLFQKDIIGVIGITGEIEEVEQYANIIKKMSEILVKETYVNQFQEKQLEYSEFIVHSILTNQELESIEYNFNTEHYCIVGEFDSNILKYYKVIFECLKQIFPDMMFKHKFNGNKLFILRRINSQYDIKNSLSQIRKKLHQYINHDIYFGIGPIANNFTEAHESFHIANQTLDWNIHLHKQTILFYKELDLGLLFADTQSSSINQYIKKIISSIPNDEYDELKEIFEAYRQFNKSITKAAEHLFIHKNTFQYKLNKIETYTGYDPKDLTDFVKLYLAFLLNR